MILPPTCESLRSEVKGDGRRHSGTRHPGCASSIKRSEWRQTVGRRERDDTWSKTPPPASESGYASISIAEGVGVAVGGCKLDWPGRRAGALGVSGRAGRSLPLGRPDGGGVADPPPPSAGPLSGCPSVPRVPPSVHQAGDTRPASQTDDEGDHKPAEHAPGVQPCDLAQKLHTVSPPSPHGSAVWQKSSCVAHRKRVRRGVGPRDIGGRPIFQSDSGRPGCGGSPDDPVGWSLTGRGHAAGLSPRGRA